MRIVKLVVVLLVLCASTLISQGRYTEQFSAIASMNGSSTFRIEDSNKINSIHLLKVNISTSVNIFIIDNVFCGMGLDFDETRQDNKTISNTFLGPNVGYTFSIPDIQLYPYLYSGIRLTTNDISEQNSFNGSDFIIGAGFMFQVKEHLGLNIEFGYHNTKLKTKLMDEYISTKDIRISMGASYLIFGH